MNRPAITCDAAHCLAIFLAPEREQVEVAMAAAGWQLLPDGHRCPGCLAGRGPVLERGECPLCCGSAVDRPDGARCHYCHHIEPHPPEDW